MIGLIMGIATCITGGIIISDYISGVISVVVDRVNDKNAISVTVGYWVAWRDGVSA